MNSTQTKPNGQTVPAPQAPPPPKKATAAAGPAPSTAPPAPPPNARIPPRSSSTPNPNTSQTTLPPNATHTTAQTPAKNKKKTEATPPDPGLLYENVKNRIAALEEAKHQGEEDERRAAEEAREMIKGSSDSMIKHKYVELFQEMKRLEREFAKEKQKLVKEKDFSKSQLTKANLAKTKLESLARELQRENKKLRDDTKRLASNVEDAQDEIIAMKDEMEKRLEQAKRRERKTQESPNIVVKVVCRYRAEMLFKISRKSKLSLLFNAWTERMEDPSNSRMDKNSRRVDSNRKANAGPKDEGKAKAADGDPPKPKESAQFLFWHLGKSIDADHTPEELDMEGGDEILAVEIMDLTEDISDEYIAPVAREKIKKNWTDNPPEAKGSIEEVFNGVVRERLKHVVRQYELREKHFECVIRSKELELFISRAKVDAQRHLAEEEIRQLRHRMDELQESQTRFLDKLLDCCQKPTGEWTQRLFEYLREESERRGLKAPTINGLDIPPLAPLVAGG
ncbi:hypothetical protein FRB99_006969 [Tulasnella sp. 403]|nr:hypothetical protein FRB99_006969 [Tulasnella sp. 403]